MLLLTFLKEIILLCAIVTFAQILDLRATYSKEVVYELEVDNYLSVYSRPKRSKRFLKLKDGEKVEISEKFFGKKKKYRRVTVKYKGNRRYGYVKQKSIKGFKITSLVQFGDEVKQELIAADKVYFGLAGSFSYLSQSGSDLSSDEGPSFEVGALSGSSIYPSLFFSLPFGDLWRFRGFGSYRKIKLAGEVCLLLSNVCSSFQPFEKNQSFLGAGIILKKYWSVDRKFWWGGGVEFGKIISSAITINEVTTEELDVTSLPAKIIVYLNFGYEFYLGKDYVLDPEIRLGGFISSTPKIINAELLMNFSYKF